MGRSSILLGTQNPLSVIGACPLRMSGCRKFLGLQTSSVVGWALRSVHGCPGAVESAPFARLESPIFGCMVVAGTLDLASQLTSRHLSPIHFFGAGLETAVEYPAVVLLAAVLDVHEGLDAVAAANPCLRPTALVSYPSAEVLANLGELRLPFSRLLA